MMEVWNINKMEARSGKIELDREQKINVYSGSNLK
jgi:hypothetical protein